MTLCEEVAQKKALSTRKMAYKTPDSQSLPTITMNQHHHSGLYQLIETLVGARRAGNLWEALEIPPQLSEQAGRISRGELSMALGLLLFDDVCQRVPMASAYVGDALRGGHKLTFDHGALRTVAMDSGELPAGRAAVARILEPLGYEMVGVYPLDDLGMTGFVYAHEELPEGLPQYFVSELHPERFSSTFQETVARVVGTSLDPLPTWAVSLLGELESNGSLSFEKAQRLLPSLQSCFDRQHSEPRLSDYELLAAESAEMAWIATEGNAFNHATDRVPNVAVVAETQRLLGRPMKEALEISNSGRVVQTAFRAALVERLFLDETNRLVSKQVPGSFHEIISRGRRDDGSLDLAFDAGNAQGIFKMTDYGIAT